MHSYTLNIKCNLYVITKKYQNIVNFSLYLNLILSEFMGIEIEALFPEWEKPARMNRSY